MARYMNGHTGFAQALTDHHGLRALAASQTFDAHGPSSRRTLDRRGTFLHSGRQIVAEPR
jgi:hypothetical protein